MLRRRCKVRSLLWKASDRPLGRGECMTDGGCDDAAGALFVAACDAGLRTRAGAWERPLVADLTGAGSRAGLQPRGLGFRLSASVVERRLGCCAPL